MVIVDSDHDLGKETEILGNYIIFIFNFKKYVLSQIFRNMNKISECLFQFKYLEKAQNYRDQFQSVKCIYV